MDKVQKERERCLEIVKRAIEDNEQRAVRAVLTRIANEIAESTSDGEPRTSDVKAD